MEQFKARISLGPEPVYLRVSLKRQQAFCPEETWLTGVLCINIHLNVVLVSTVIQSSSGNNKLCCQHRNSDKIFLPMLSNCLPLTLPCKHESINIAHSLNLANAFMSEWIWCHSQDRKPAVAKHYHPAQEQEDHYQS